MFIQQIPKSIKNNYSVANQMHQSKLIINYLKNIVHISYILYKDLHRPHVTNGINHCLPF